jgi:hypothetical protein
MRLGSVRATREPRNDKGRALTVTAQNRSPLLDLKEISHDQTAPSGALNTNDRLYLPIPSAQRTEDMPTQNHQGGDNE